MSATKNTEASLAQALIDVQLEMPAIEPDATNPHFKSEFVSLGHLLAKARPILNRHGFAVMQAPSLNDEGAFVLRTRLMHTSGEEVSFDYPLKPTKDDPQGQGSAITYARRYALAAALAISDQEDDDGNQGSAPAKPKEQVKPSNGSAPGQITRGRAIAIKKLWKDSGVDPAHFGMGLITVGVVDVDATDEKTIDPAVDRLTEEQADRIEERLLKVIAEKVEVSA